MDWWLWRLALAEPIRASIHEIRSWTWRDVYEAHVALDAHEELAEYHRQEAERRAGR